MLEVLFGLISGIISSLGMGGGTILIFLLTVFLGVSQHVSQATNLVFFIPTSIVAIFINIKNKNIDWKISWIIVIFGIIGAICGSFIARKISSDNLRRYFAIFLIFITVYEIYAYYKMHIKTSKSK